MEKIREQLEAELQKIQQVIDTASLTNLRQRVQTVITEVKTNINQHLDRFEEANAVADQFVDPYLEKATRSKWTALIIGAVVLGSFILGLIVGTHA
jgi:ElaB/YqjD/DUF883 family membrane-anchored ribosome-binding protein